MNCHDKRHPIKFAESLVGIDLLTFVCKILLQIMSLFHSYSNIKCINVTWSQFGICIQNWKSVAELSSHFCWYSEGGVIWPSALWYYISLHLLKRICLAIYLPIKLLSASSSVTSLVFAFFSCTDQRCKLQEHFVTCDCPTQIFRRKKFLKLKIFNF